MKTVHICVVVFLINLIYTSANQDSNDSSSNTSAINTSKEEVPSTTGSSTEGSTQTDQPTQSLVATDTAPSTTNKDSSNSAVTENGKSTGGSQTSSTAVASSTSSEGAQSSTSSSIHNLGDKSTSEVTKPHVPGESTTTTSDSHWLAPSITLCLTTLLLIFL